jgi:hypothetical protein
MFTTQSDKIDKKTRFYAFKITHFKRVLNAFFDKKRQKTALFFRKTRFECVKMCAFHA